MPKPRVPASGAGRNGLWDVPKHSLHKVGRQCVGVKGRVPFSRAFSGDPLPEKILEDPTRWCTPTLLPPPHGQSKAAS